MDYSKMGRTSRGRKCVAMLEHDDDIGSIGRIDNIDRNGRKCHKGAAQRMGPLLRSHV